MLETLLIHLGTEGFIWRWAKGNGLGTPMIFGSNCYDCPWKTRQFFCFSLRFRRLFTFGILCIRCHLKGKQVLRGCCFDNGYLFYVISKIDRLCYFAQIIMLLFSVNLHTTHTHAHTFKRKSSNSFIPMNKSNNQVKVWRINDHVNWICNIST